MRAFFRQGEAFGSGPSRAMPGPCAPGGPRGLAPPASFPPGRAVLAGLLLASCAASCIGCAGVPAFEEDERVAALMAAGDRPLAGFAGLAPPAIAFDPDKENREARGHWSLPPTGAELGAGALEALKAIGLFEKIAPLEAAPSSPEESFLKEAWDREMDFLVQLRLEKWNLVYRGTNGWFLPNLLLAFQFWIPAWFVPDETYAVEAAATVVVKSVHSGRTIAEERIEFECREGLDDFERGWILLGLFRLPGALDRSNWESVGAAIGPRAAHEFRVELARKLSASLRRLSGTEEYRDRTRKRLALVVGTQNYGNHKLPQAVFGRQDAESVHRFLTDAGEGGFFPNNVRFLAGEAATAEAIRRGVSEFLVKRARPGDEAFLYFSGLGSLAAVEDPWTGERGPLKRFLLPYDADPDRVAETCVPLDWLLDCLQGGAAGSVVVLDASFKPGGGNRSYSPPGTPSPAAIPPLSGRPGVVLVGACAPDQECGGLEARGQGFFAYFLLQGLSQKADMNDDGRVTLEEAFLFAKENTEVQSFVEGSGEQSPFLDGERAREIILKEWR